MKFVQHRTSKTNYITECCLNFPNFQAKITLYSHCFTHVYSNINYKGDAQEFSEYPN